MIQTLATVPVVALLLAVVTGCGQFYAPASVDPATARVIVNPYGVAPLAAVLDISSSSGIHAGSVRRVDVSLEDPRGGTVRWTLPYGSAAYRTNFDTSDLPEIPPDDLVIPLLGLAPDAQTVVSVEIFDDASRRRYAYVTTVIAPFETDTADPLRNGYPKVSILTAPSRKTEPDTTLVSFSMGNNGRFMTRPFVIDSAGEIRWALRLDELQNWASPVERLANGNLVLGRGEYVYEYSMLGRRVNAWDIGRYGYTQHHDVFEIAKGPRTGHLLVAVDRVGADSVEDFVIEIDRTGALVDTWDLRQVLDVTRDDIIKNATDWLHMNALFYDDRDDTLLVSGRNQGVAKVGRDHALRWILAPHRGWGQAGPSGDGPDTSARLLTAVSATGSPFPEEVQQGAKGVDGGRTFDWPWGQHSVELLSNGDLFLFDNGFNRHFRGRRDGFSRAVEYRIDQGARRVRQVWQYGADRGTDFYSDIISDVDVIPGTTHRLITSGSIRNSRNGPHAYVTEITYPDGKVVFEARLGFKDAHSNLKAGGWGNMDIVYRAERMPLYPHLAARSAGK